MWGCEDSLLADVAVQPKVWGRQKRRERQGWVCGVCPPQPWRPRQEELAFQASLGKEAAPVSKRRL